MDELIKKPFEVDRDLFIVQNNLALGEGRELLSFTSIEVVSCQSPPVGCFLSMQTEIVLGVLVYLICSPSQKKIEMNGSEKILECMLKENRRAENRQSYYPSTIIVPSSSFAESPVNS